MRPNFVDVFPDFALEVLHVLHAEDRRALARQVPALQLVDRCHCGDSFCSTVYFVKPPKGAWGAGYRTVPLSLNSKGMINLDVKSGRIVAMEVLDRPDVRRILNRAIPLKARRRAIAGAKTEKKPTGVAVAQRGKASRRTRPKP